MFPGKCKSLYRLLHCLPHGQRLCTSASHWLPAPPLLPAVGRTCHAPARGREVNSDISSPHKPMLPTHGGRSIATFLLGCARYLHGSGEWTRDSSWLSLIKLPQCWQSWDGIAGVHAHAHAQAPALGIGGSVVGSVEGEGMQGPEAWVAQN